MSRPSAGRDVCATLLGVAQDGGRPQAGCVRPCCAPAHLEPGLKRHPVSLGVVGKDHSTHLFEATRSLSWQFECWHRSDPTTGPLDSVWITHAHHGHVDGLGLFGREVLNAKGLPLHCSPSFSRLLDKTPNWRLMLEQGVFSPRPFQAGKPVSPSGREVEGCGFSVTPIAVPHRAELSDMHAMLIEGEHDSLLFLPDHDTWEETLATVGFDSIRQWFTELGVGVVLLDATFWSAHELTSRKQADIPHPPVVETVERLGQRREGDPRVVFIHLNHTNPLHDLDSAESQMVTGLGWEIGIEGMCFEL